MKKGNVITISDVAEALGVSKTTVSRAISGKGRIGEATRQKVLAYIEEHDYKPNVIARGLAQSKTFNLCVVMPEDYALVDLPFFQEGGKPSAKDRKGHGPGKPACSARMRCTDSDCGCRHGLYSGSGYGNSCRPSVYPGGGKPACGTGTDPHSQGTRIYGKPPECLV